tara:strand:- start:5480 stop:6178 length:699 start_codon:yes stop_codon:yes gene_type:complete
MRNNNRIDVMRLLDEYNKSPNKFTDEQAEKIAQVAKAYGVNFKRENKAGRKLVFDLADTALLGMIPNDWRPTSRGQEAFGETAMDRVGGAVGTVAGIAGTGGAAWLGRKAIGTGVGKGLGYAHHYGKKGAGKALEYGGRGYSKASELSGRAFSQGKKIYADGPSLMRRAGERVNKGMQYTRQKSANLSSLNRGTKTSYIGQLKNEFMEPIRNQNLLDMLDEVRRGIPMGGYG